MKKIVLAWLIAMLGFIFPAEAARHRGKNPYSQPLTQSQIYSDDTTSGYFMNEAIRQGKVKQQDAPVKVNIVTNNIASGELVQKASRYMGATASQLGLPRTLWCADFMNMLVGGKDRRAISYAHRGSPASYGCTNCVVVTGRRGGEHVGIVQGYDQKGNPILISGNHARKVGVGVYPKNRVIAYRYI
jgi:uncharacterized protein (TIGR02594 family)